MSKKEKTRIRRHMVMNGYKNKLDKLLQSKTANVRLLYRIFAVDANLIPFNKVVKLERLADTLIREMVASGRLLDDSEKNRRIRKNLVRKGKRQFLTEFRRDAYTRYASGERENLIPLV